MKTLGAVLILLVSSVALASPGGGGGGGGGGSHGGGGSGGGGHASAGSASHGGGASRGLSAGHAAATPAGLTRAGTPLAHSATPAAKPPPKPGFWRRHFHFHHYAANTVPMNYGIVCSEEDRRLGRCPERAPQKR